MKFIAGLATGALIACAMGFAATPAKAQIFGHKKPKEDYSVSRPVPVAAQPPRPANGSIFQASEGYAALYEGQRARRVGDPLTIVLVERTSASKSSGTKLDSGGGFSLTPPSAGPLSFNPNAANAFASRGLAYLRKGDNDRAMADLNEAIRLNPREPFPYLNRGVIYGRKGDHARAIADYGEAITRNPKLALAFCNRGRAKLKINDASANEDLAKARELDASVCR